MVSILFYGSPDFRVRIKMVYGHPTAACQRPDAMAASAE